MTDEEKAKELKANDVCCVCNDGCPNVYHAAMEMADWKDQQFAEEKEHWIDKAVDYIYTHAHVTTFGDIRLDKCCITHFVENFKQVMEE